MITLDDRKQSQAIAKAKLALSKAWGRVRVTRRALMDAEETLARAKLAHSRELVRVDEATAELRRLEK